MKIAILSTNEKNILHLRKIILNYSMKKLFDCDMTIFGDYKNFLNSDEVFDILFVDDCAREQTSLILTKQIRALKPNLAIVILSSRPEAVYEAFPLKAFRFLLTPASPAAVCEALDSYQRESLTSSCLITRIDKKYCSIPLSEIIFIMSKGREAHICTTNEMLVSITPFPHLGDQLPRESFFICHRCTAVNMQFISEFMPTTISLKNGMTLPLSKRKKTDFYLAYHEFLKSNSYI